VLKYKLQDSNLNIYEFGVKLQNYNQIKMCLREMSTVPSKGQTQSAQQQNISLIQD